SVLAEPKKRIRHAALDVLESKKDPNAALYFTSALSSESPILRINAAHALMRFPDRRSIAPLIVTLRHETGDFGRAHIVNFTQRAYIKDFELSSGGTGLAIAEVADPVIDTFTEGTVLDVKVRKVEWYSKAAVLTHLTGADFGIKQVAWRNWYKKNKGQLALSPAAQKRRKAYLASKN
ncbi:MAG: HEAT repeat domain-containing protein, partial [Planctomycetota bacterium]|nr:HEAT repeat domain-containing protein [Planctomycetota bacterium]